MAAGMRVSSSDPADNEAFPQIDLNVCGEDFEILQAVARKGEIERISSEA
jgi:hypothetical protein